MNLNLLVFRVDIPYLDELTKIQRRKINFMNRFKYAEHIFFCSCLEFGRFYIKVQNKRSKVHLSEDFILILCDERKPLRTQLQVQSET